MSRESELEAALRDLALAYRDARGLDGAHDNPLQRAERLLEPEETFEHRELRLTHAYAKAMTGAASSVAALEGHVNVLNAVLHEHGMVECKGYRQAKVLAGKLELLARAAANA